MSSFLLAAASDPWSSWAAIAERFSCPLLSSFPLAAASDPWWSWAAITERLRLDPSENPIWYLLGFAGMGLFSSRFIVQWIQSERRRESVIPVSFWYLSIIGSLVTLAYALHRRDPVFVLMYLFNCGIYARNLFFISQKQRLGQADPSSHSHEARRPAVR